jgi:hypothetical protein
MRTGGRRRPVWFGVTVVIVFFVGVTLAVGWVGDGGPDIPHRMADGVPCVSCHPVDGLPDAHQGRADDSRRSCHSEQRAGESAAGDRPDGLAPSGTDTPTFAAGPG